MKKGTFNRKLCIIENREYLATTFVSLLNEQALINKQGGVFQKFDKRAGSNKRAEWNFHLILTNEQALINEQGELFQKFHYSHSLNYW